MVTLAPSHIAAHASHYKRRMIIESEHINR